MRAEGIGDFLRINRLLRLEDVEVLGGKACKGNVLGERDQGPEKEGFKEVKRLRVPSRAEEIERQMEYAREIGRASCRERVF